MAHSFRWLVVGPVMAALAGCASFAGMPKPVFSAAQMDALLQRYPIDQVLIHYHSSNSADRSGLTPRQWRDFVAGIYLSSADARYNDFRQSLSRETKGSGIFADLGVLGLTGAGAVASSGAANVLSAAAAGLTGARSALSKEIYFERTLPALIAGMDAARTGIRTQIYTKLSQKDEAGYPLELALSDIEAYQNSASIDGAIQLVTSAAVAKADEAQSRFNDLIYVAPVRADKDVALIGHIKAKLLSWAGRKNVMAITLALSAAGATTIVDPSGDLHDVVVDIMLRLNSPDFTTARLESFVSDLSKATGESI